MTVLDVILILLRRWPIVLAVTALGGLVGYVYESTQPDVFVAEGRVLIGPSLTQEASIVEITDSLARGTLQQTLAEVVTGSEVRAAADAVVPGTSAYVVTSLVIPEANAVRINVQGDDPGRAEELGAAVIAEVESSFETSYPIYDVALLAVPTSPEQPQSPNPELGAVVGAAIGGMLGAIALLFAQDPDVPVDSAGTPGRVRRDWRRPLEAPRAADPAYLAGPEPAEDAGGRAPGSGRSAGGGPPRARSRPRQRRRSASAQRAPRGQGPTLVPSR